MLELIWIAFIVEVECHSSQGTRQPLTSPDPDGSDHSQSWVILPVPEFKGVVLGLNVNSPRSNKDRLESNALCTDVAMRGRLGTLPYCADSCQIILFKPVFIALDNDAVGMYVEYNRGR